MKTVKRTSVYLAKLILLLAGGTIIIPLVMCLPFVLFFAGLAGIPIIWDIAFIGKLLGAGLLITLMMMSFNGVDIKY